MEAAGRGGIFKNRDMERLLSVCTRTIQRRRLLDPVYEPDYIDDTGHPVWEAPKVNQILATIKAKAKKKGRK